MSKSLSSEQWKRVRRHFDELADLPENTWQDALGKIDTSPEIAEEVAALLAARAHPDQGIEKHFSRMIAHAAADECDVGDLLGPWRLCEKLGVGGMATVFRAERADGLYEQTVAIKLLHGMSAEGQSERLSAERQMLAGLGLRNISRLLDGGSTPEGDPFIVMEFIKGEHLDDYCRRMSLNIGQRIDLFFKVCEVVRRAHERLVVHCDLKPENIIVTLDGEPILLDFGIARMMRASDADQYGRAFTPTYAAPELVSAAPVSAATDVFSLGVILFELLSDRDSGRAGFAVGTPLPNVSGWTLRPHAWQQKLVGDLDAIVARACSLDVSTRYASVEALVAELRSWRDRRPVSARNGGQVYVFGRWFLRQWQGVAIAAIFVALTTVFIYNLVQARRDAELESRTARDVSNYLVQMFESTDPAQRGENAEKPLTARELLDAASQRVEADFDGNPLQRARMQAALGQAYQNLGISGKANTLLQRAIAQLEAQRPRPEKQLASLYGLLALERSNNSDGRNGVQLANRGLDLLGDKNEPVLKVNLLYARGVGETTLQKFEVARQSLTEAQSLLKTLPDSIEPELRLRVFRAQALLSMRWGRLKDAEQHYRDALAHLPPSRKSDVHDIETALAQVLRTQGLYSESRRLLEKGLSRALALFGGDSRYVLEQYEALADLYREMGDYKSADAAFKTLSERIANVEGNDSLRYSMALFNHADLLVMRKDFASAEPMFRASVRIRQVRLGRASPTALRAELGLANFLITRGRLTEGKPLLQEASAGLEKRLPGDAPALFEVAMAKARFALAEGRWAEADEALRMGLRSVEERQLAFQLRLLRVRIHLAKGEREAARKLTRESVAVLERTVPPESAELAEWRSNLALQTLQEGDIKESTQLLAKAIPVLDLHWIPGPDLAKLHAL